MADDLIYAVINDDTGSVILLLDQGVNPNIPDDDGYTALMAASVQDNTDIIRLLLNRGASINLQDILH